MYFEVLSEQLSSRQTEITILEHNNLYSSCVYGINLWEICVYYSLGLIFLALAITVIIWEPSFESKSHTTQPSWLSKTHYFKAKTEAPVSLRNTGNYPPACMHNCSKYDW